MTDFAKLRAICETNTEISGRLLDEFLIYFAASQEKLEAEMNKRLKPYKHISSRLEESWV